MRARRGVLFGEEGAPPLGRHAHHVEVVARDHLAQDQLGLAVALDVAHVHGVGRHVVEDVGGAVVDQLVDAPAREVVAAVRAQGVDVDQGVRVAHAPLLEEHGVDQREDGRVRPDPQGEREDGDGGEGRRLADHAQGELQVGEQGVMRPSPGPVAR